MSSEKSPTVSRQTQSLIEALNAQIPGGAANEEECTVCDLIEQRLGRRTDTCAPLTSEALRNRPALSSSARQGLAYETCSEPILSARAHQDEPVNTPKIRLALTEDAPWQSTIGELNAALALAMSHLEENAKTPEAIGPQQKRGADRLDKSSAARGQGDLLTLREELAVHAPDLVEGTSASEPDYINAGVIEPSIRPDRRWRIGVRSALQLGGLAMLILTLGLLPFTPSVLVGLMPEAPATATPKARPSTALAIASTSPSSSQPTKELPAALPERHPAPSLPKAQSVELSLERIYRGKPGMTLALPISAKQPIGSQAGAFAAIRGFPSGSTLSQGQALGPNLWTVPLDDLAGLKICLPADAPDVSLMTIEAFDAQSALLAQAAFVVVATHPAEPTLPASKPNAPAPAVQIPVPHFKQDIAGWSNARGSSNKDNSVFLMVSARHRQHAIEPELSWSNIQPRQNLVHVALAMEDIPRVANSGTSASPPPQYSAGRLELSNATDDPRLSRTESKATADRPEGMDDLSHWQPYKPQPDLARLVKRPQYAAKPPPPAENDNGDETEQPHAKIKSPAARIHREEPPVSAKPSNDRETKTIPPTSSSRGNKQAGGISRGGPVPRRNSPASANAPTRASGGAVGSAEVKTRLRQELMDSSKGI